MRSDIITRIRSETVKAHRVGRDGYLAAEIKPAVDVGQGSALGLGEFDGDWAFAAAAGLAVFVLMAATRRQKA